MPALEPKETSNFLIVGTVRNCRAVLERNIERIETAVGKAAGIQWFLVTSDCEDGTNKLLKRLARKKPNLRYVSLGKLRSKLRSRVRRIGHCRNRYVEEIRTNPLYQDTDFVVVADMDDLNTKLTPEAFATCWTRDDWDMCAANQSALYYDTFALRHPHWCPYDIFHQLEFLRKYRRFDRLNLLVSVWGLKLRIPPDSEWIEVDSAFGGLAVYKRHLFDAGSYTSEAPEDKRVCEHVIFHKTLREKGARLFINPALINAHRTEHSPPLFWHLVTPNWLKDIIHARFRIRL